ncbi:MAG: hypothetical protein SAL70_18030 [Scytonema sp. PMC 1070.18]|nr:hypothetical protein [Scytonema sp. PMC 1070.18]
MSRSFGLMAIALKLRKRNYDVVFAKYIAIPILEDVFKVFLLVACTLHIPLNPP